MTQKGRSLTTWFSLYEESHQHPVNRRIHKVAVPAILWCCLGLLTAVPLMYGLSLAAVVGVGYLAFALCLDARLGIGLAVQLSLMGAAAHLYRGMVFRQTFIFTWVALFIIAWIAQFVGHVIEKRRPSFLTDLGFLFIGPLWTLSLLYAAWGLSPRQSADKSQNIGK